MTDALSESNRKDKENKPSPYANEEFWVEYGEYLKESLIRHADTLWSMLSHIHGDTCEIRYSAPEVLDFGCGQYASAIGLMPVPKSYIGIDKHNPGSRWDDSMHDPVEPYTFITGDYRERINLSYEPTCFTSLFSTEVTAYRDANESFYNWVFESYPTASYGIVSGFYYLDRWRDQYVIETGNLTSCQSTGPLTDYTDSTLLYTETKLEIPAPSKMFGPNVVEVWKLLERK